MRFPLFAGLIVWLAGSAGARADPPPRRLDLALHEAPPVERAVERADELVRAGPPGARRDLLSLAADRVLAGPLVFMSSIAADRFDALACGLLGLQDLF